MQTKTQSKEFKDLIFGIHPVLEAIESGQEVNKILILRSEQNENLSKIVRQARQKNIIVQRVPQEKLNRVTRKNHQGVIAFLSPITYDILDEILPRLFEEGKNPLIIVLDGVTDVRNMGAICRSAECMGAHAIVLPSKGGALINSDAVKTSAGAVFNLSICKVDELKDALNLIKQSGLQIIACTEKGDRTLSEGQFSNPTAVLLGAEDTGIKHQLIKLADQQLRIPMSGKTLSLNVAVSAGVVLYECSRQRLQIK